MLHTACLKAASWGVASMLARSSPKEIIARWANDILTKHGCNAAEAARRAGVQSSTMHRLLGRDPGYHFMPSIRIMTKLAEAFGEPLPHLGPDGAAGFAEEPLEQIAAPDTAGDDDLGPAQTIWKVTGGEFVPAGYLPGDMFVLDQSGLALRDGDHVVVNIEDEAAGTAETTIRIVKRDLLLPPNPASTEILHIESRRVAVMGVIVRSWRQRR